MSAEPKETKPPDVEIHQTVADEQKHWLQLAYQPEEIIECRILGVIEPGSKFSATYAGYYQYSKIDKLIKDLWPYCNLYNPKSGYASGVYTVLNPINLDLLARSYNRLKRQDAKSSLATDKDVSFRRWLLIDCDPIRPADISSTNEEKELSLNRAKEIRNYLIQELGFPEQSFIYATSGNGSHLPIRIETLPNNDASRDLIANCLKALDNKFTDDKVKVDTGVFNASRIWKLYGSIARKGDSTPSRHHRYAKILESPEKLEACSKELLEKLVSLALTEGKKNYSIPNSNVVNIPNKNKTNDPQSIIERARRYLFCIPGAISGQSGHSTTYYAANVLINGFDLSFNDAFSLLLEWNSTCQPAWSDAELEHKLRDAEQKGSIKFKSYLLKQNDSQTIKWDDSCSSDANLEEINIHDLKRDNLVRIRGQKWTGKVADINGREVTILFKNKNALVKYDISELLWKNKNKNRSRSNVSHTISSSSDSQSSSNESAQAKNESTDQDKDSNFSMSQQEFFLLISLAQKAIDDNELGDAKLFANIFQDQLCFDHSVEKWYRYDRVFWKLDKINLINILVAENLTEEYEDKKNKLAKARNLSSLNLSDEQKKETDSLVEQIDKRISYLKGMTRVTKVLKFAESILGITGEQWDIDPWLLGVTNGVLDLRTGQLRDGDPTDFIKTVAPVEWKGLNEPCPRFEQFLSEIFEDKIDCDEIVAALNRLFGYAITGLSTEHIFPIFFGFGGRNGKDTLFETLGHVLGSLTGAADKDVLIENKRSNTGSATPHLRDLQGKRLVWASETNQGARLNVGQVKLVTGGGRIKARNLHENLVEFNPTHLLCLITNNKPHITSEDNAIWERLILLSFDLSFIDNPSKSNERQRDPNLREKLKQESSGILAWLVRGCLSWQKQGLNIPASLKHAKQEYRDSEDTIKLFITECCILDTGAITPASQLYDAYSEWAERTRSQPMSGTVFGERMSKRFENKHTNKGKIYKGIALVPPS